VLEDDAQRVLARAQQHSMKYKKHKKHEKHEELQHAVCHHV